MTTILSANTQRFQSGGWIADNNVWNPGPLRNGEDFTQTIRIEERTFPRDTLIRWDWPYDSRRPLTYENYPVRAYPELTRGINPWKDEPSTTRDFPRRIGGLQNLDVAYDFAITGDGNLHNVAFSLWIGDDPAAGLAGITDEVMVWVHTGYFSPAGNMISPYQDENGTGEVWNEKDFSGGIDGNPIAWEYTAVKYDEDQLQGVLDLDGILDDLQRAGIVDGDDWIMGIQVGAEVTGGTGSLEIDRLSVNLTEAGPMGFTDALSAVPQPHGAFDIALFA